jgi:dihydrolipoamide dehydrogenase
MVVGDIETGTEVAVVGAGPAGYVAAIRAGQLGLDVTLVEKDAWGGTCLNYGCIPSKALITAADLAHEAGDAEHMGIHADPAVDLSATVDWKDGVVDRLTGGVEKLCKANGVELVEGRAEFADDGRLRVVHGGDGQGAETLAFEHAVVATGSRPIEIPGFDFDDEPVLDSRQALALESVPDRLVMVGAGYIGMELSTTFAKLGSDVTVVETLEDVLPGYEDDVARVVRERAREVGVDFRFGYTAAGWESTDDGIRVTADPAEEVAADGGTAVDADADVDTDADAEPIALPADKAMVAVGRRPVTDTLNLEAAGVEIDDRGFVETDHRTTTSVDGIHAVGDVAGEPMLAHAGSAEGQVAAEVIAGEPAALDHQAVPAAVFTDPEIGTVGLTAAEAREEGFEPAVGEFPFRSSGRALTTDEDEGFVRIVADEATGFVLGGQVVGPEASELIAEVGLAVEMGATLEDLASTVHTHPTLSEAVMEAAEHAVGEAIHTLNR